FDKPDPLVGPFFEETIYTTPSRLPDKTQAEILATTKRACAALGLREGPIHAELRVNDHGARVVEVAGRSIGGLCAKILRFGTEHISLEELIIRQAMGMESDLPDREEGAGGVMMIPIPARGILTAVEGLEEARAIAGIEEIDITIALKNKVIPLPEGASYLGFIFARGDSPARVEAILREAHSRLRFVIEPEITLTAG
ncbi:MAG TPA: ATP-grasp domain-containing protein, partial [Anaerolineae bacterium]